MTCFYLYEIYKYFNHFWHDTVLLKLLEYNANYWYLNNIIKKKMVERAKVGHGSL